MSTYRASVVPGSIVKMWVSSTVVHFANARHSPLPGEVSTTEASGAGAAPENVTGSVAGSQERTVGAASARGARLRSRAGIRDIGHGLLGT
jgi:hypothetical protein